MPHRVGVRGAVRGDRGLLHAHRRQVQKLVEDPRGDRVERPALVVGEPALQLCELGLANLLGPRPQRRDRGHDVERRLPGPEALGLLGDELLGPLGLGATAGERLGDDGLEVVDVVEEAAVEPLIAGSRSRGTAMSMKKSGVRRRCAGTSAGGARAPGRSSTRRRRRPRRAGSRRSSSLSASPPKRAASSRAARSVRFATNAISAPRDARFAAASSPIRPAPIEQHAAPVQLAEHLRRERRRGRRDRRRALADRGLGAHALADGERLAEHAVEQRPGRNRLVGGTHLAEDLALARDERVEPGGDPEEMQRGGSSRRR